MTGLLRRVSLVIGIAALGVATAGVAFAHRTTQPPALAVSAAVSQQPLLVVGERNARSIADHLTPTNPTRANEQPIQGPQGVLPRSGGTPPPVVAAPPATPVSGPGPGRGQASPSSPGFMGMTGTIQAAANSAYDLEPPDQGLCSNGIDIVEAVNNAYAVYSPTGQELLPPIPLSQLFGISGESFGTFTSDPRCVYDAASGRWFVVELSIPKYFSAHGHATRSYELIAVSDTSDPTGSYTTFAIDTTDPSDPGCPCFGDFPMIGLDANGVYLTTNEFSIYKPNFNGVQLYAISKAQLVAAAAGAPAPAVVHFSSLASPFPGETVGETYHLSPALTPSDGSFDAAAGGTELFAMSDAFPVASDLLAVYALTDTSSLGTASPALQLTASLVPLGQTYQFPTTGMAVAQAPATAATQTPLLDYVAQQTGAAVAEGVLQADFQAVQETTYANGDLYTELSSAASPTAAVGVTSAQWYVLTPTVGAQGLVSAALTGEGTVAAPGGNSLLYPDLVVNGSGRGDMVFTLTGPNYFPSAASIAFGPQGPTGAIQVAAAGSGPEDGFTCYAYYVGLSYGGCRWGDFSGGVAVGSTVWLATEYVPPQSTRDFYTNWGTFIFSAPAG